MLKDRKFNLSLFQKRFYCTEGRKAIAKNKYKKEGGRCSGSTGHFRLDIAHGTKIADGRLSRQFAGQFVRNLGRLSRGH